MIVTTCRTKSDATNAEITLYSLVATALAFGRDGQIGTIASSPWHFLRMAIHLTADGAYRELKCSHLSNSSLHESSGTSLKNLEAARRHRMQANPITGRRRLSGRQLRNRAARVSLEGNLRHGTTLSFHKNNKDRLTAFAEEARRKAGLLEAGAKRDDLLTKAGRADTAVHLDDWASTPGLRSPKWQVASGRCYSFSEGSSAFYAWSFAITALTSSRIFRCVSQPVFKPSKLSSSKSISSRRLFMRENNSPELRLFPRFLSSSFSVRSEYGLGSNPSQQR